MLYLRDTSPNSRAADHRMVIPWQADLRREILSRQSLGGGWSYTSGGECGVEPTALAMIALAATSPVGQIDREVQNARSFLYKLQQSDGSLGPTESLRTPGWPTSLALWAWTTSGGSTTAINRARAWLVSQRGTTFYKPEGSPLAHDTTLPGWAWVADTHSWVEPTALSVIALRLAGVSNHYRLRQALELLHDRAIPSGGWNYGNSEIFGRALRPKPGPTGLALMALAGTTAETPTITRACEYLEAELPKLRAGQSLGLGVLGLRAWQRRPADRELWLERAFGHAKSISDSTVALSWLLLASADHSPVALGAPSNA